MFPLDVTLNPQTQGGANVDKTYSLLGTTLTSSTRRVSATATTTPETLTVSHRKVKKGLVTEDQHMVRLDKEYTDPDKGTVKLSGWLVLNVPLSVPAVTEQEILDLHGRLLAFTRASGAIPKILNSEV